jgi:CubicO group peptidase (beta-lactamase class C family)
MDPKLAADLDTKAAYHPQLRSLLVIRHGDLIYERYWDGNASTGQEAFSVTKSFTGALVGIALGDHKLKGLDQTVGELLAAHLPAAADPRIAKVTVGQLLTMTAGLAGDDPSPGGDPGLTVRPTFAPPPKPKATRRRASARTATATSGGWPASTATRASLPMASAARSSPTWTWSW